MRIENEDWFDKLILASLYMSLEVKFLLGIRSDTPLIKKERSGSIRIAARIGNQKRYNEKHIHKLLDDLMMQ
mgnify:CR=1 FL=1